MNVKNLNSEDQEVYRLLKTMNQREISRVLNVTPQRISQRVNRMRQLGIKGLPDAHPSQGKTFRPIYWSDEDLSLLRKMYINNYSTEEIASALSRTVGSVYAKIINLRKHGNKDFSPRSLSKWTEEDIAYLINAYNQRVDNLYISRILKKSISNVSSKISELLETGILAPKIYDYDYIKWEVLDLRKQGHLNPEIGAILNRSVVWVGMIIKKMQKEGIKVPRSSYFSRYQK